MGPQVSWSSFDNKDYRDQYQVKPVWGYHAGFNVSFRVQKRFFLHSSFLYSQKGKIIEGKDDPHLRNEVKYNYLELPILYTVEFKSKIGNGKEFKWYFGAGPNISYWLGGKGTIVNSEIKEQALTTDNVGYRLVFNKDNNDVADNQMNVEDANRLQLGLNLSAGTVFEPFGYQKIMLTVRYELGHTFLSKTGYGVFPITGEYKDVLRARNNGLRISLAYLIDLKIDQRKKGKSTIKKKGR